MLQVKIKDDTGNTIGQNIRRIRKSRNIGQTALVRDLQLLDIDMTREALVKIERGIQHIQVGLGFDYFRKSFHVLYLAFF